MCLRGRSFYNYSHYTTVCMLLKRVAYLSLVGLSPACRGTRQNLAALMQRMSGDSSSNKIKGILPTPYYAPTPTPIRLPSADTKGIFVVHIPQSPKRPHMDESAGIVY